MDRAVYIAMTGAKETFTRQNTVAHNLANVNTTGFKAQMASFRTLPVYGPGLSTRAYSVDSTPAANLSAGTIQSTGRDLDIAIQGEGWVAIQDPKDPGSGKEAYTRAGSLEINANGLLQTRAGQLVLGDSGPISIPPGSAVTIAGDGTISFADANTPAQTTTIGRIKLTNPPANNLVRSDDGLFRTKDGKPVASDGQVKLATRSIESSNVDPVESLVQMIGAARQFDLQMKLIQNVDQNERSASRIVALNN